MALINREEDGEKTLEYQNAIKAIAANLGTGDCLLFLGAGISIEDKQPAAIQAPANGSTPDASSEGVDSGPGTAPPHGEGNNKPPSLPDGKTLARDLLVGCGLKDDVMPLQQAASYYEFIFGRAKLNKELQRVIGNEAIPPSTSIRQLVDCLAACPPGIATLAVTTNYDRQFERAYKDKFREDPKVIVYEGATAPDKPGSLHTFLPPKHKDDNPYWRSKPRCSLYKVHGCISQDRDRGLVVTEEDYINFLTNALSGSPAKDKGVLMEIRGQLENSTILFLGYSLSDWNFQALYKATAERRQTIPKSYAVQFRDPSKAKSPGDRLYWNRMAAHWGMPERDVEIINARASEFTADLLEEVRRPQ